MAGALAQPLGGDLTAGSRILVFYETDVVWHTRYLLSLVDRSSWVILTPDGDIYIEDVSDANQDWSAWRVWPIGGPLPFGVDPNMVHKFNPEPNAAALQVLIAEGNQHAQQERARLGLGAPVGGPVVAAPAAAAAPNAGGGGPAGQAPAPVADLAGGGGGNVQLAAALQAPALEEAWWIPRAKTPAPWQSVEMWTATDSRSSEMQSRMPSPANSPTGPSQDPEPPSMSSARC